jgi:hypothetical protein
MKNNQDILDELNELSPMLYELKNREIEIEIPENYFEELQHNVRAKIKEEEKIIPFRFRDIVKTGMAATVFLAIIFAALHIPASKNTAAQDGYDKFASIQKNDNQYYNIKNINHYTEEETGMMFADEWTTELIAADEWTENIAAADITETEMEQYIAAHPVYMSDLIDNELTTIF